MESHSGGGWLLGCHLTLGTLGEGTLTWQTQQEESNRSHPDGSDGGAAGGHWGGRERGVIGGDTHMGPPTPRFIIPALSPHDVPHISA